MDYYEQEQDSQQGNNFLGSFLAGTAGAAAALGTQAAFGRRNALRGVRARRGQQGVVPKDVEKVREVDRRTRQSRAEQTRPVTVTDLSAQNFPTQKIFTDDQRARGAADTASASTGDPVNRGLANDQLGGPSAEQVAPSSTQSTEQVAPSPAQRAEVYKQVAAKPVSELPEVTRPQGGVDPGRITDPNTGETFSAGKSSYDVKATDANQLANEQLSKKIDYLQSEMRADRQERKLDEAVSKVEKVADDLKGRDFLSQQLQDRAYVEPKSSTPVVSDVGERLKNKGLGMSGMPGEDVLEVDVSGRSFPITSETGKQALARAGVTPDEAQKYWTNKLQAEGVLAKSSAPVASQAAEAIDTGADQQAMRVSRTVQRDPSENLAEFETVQDSLEQRGASPVQAADAAVAVTENTPAFTQTDRPLRESSAARFLASERDEIASQLAEQGLSITPGRIDKELGNRLGSESYKYGPEYTRLKQNIQLGATYDPELFDNPSKPFVRIAGEEVSTGRVPGTKLERTPYTNELIAEDVELGLRQPTYMKETAKRLQERAEKKRDWLGSVRLEEASKNAKINAELINTNRQYNETLDYSKELTDFLDSKQGTPEQRTRARQRLDDVNYELDRLDVLSEDLNQRVYGGQSGARVRGAEKFTEEYIESLTPPLRLKPGAEEGQRLFFEVDEFTGEPIAGTQEIRAERNMIDMAPKGGGGRNVAEFSAGSRDEGVEIDLGSILQEAKTPRNQSARQYTKDQFGYRPGTGLTGKALEAQPFTDDRTQTGRVITRTGIQKSGPQPGSMKAAVNPYTQLDNETLGMISLQGSEADAANAARILARRRREGYDPSTVTGPGQSQRVVSSVALTPEQKQTKIKSMDVSRQITALQRSGRPDAQQLVQKYLQELRGGI